MMQFQLHHVLPLSLLPLLTSAHVAAWTKGMYCLNGVSGQAEQNTNEAGWPLFNLTKKDWWFQHDRGCDKFPPAAGDVLNIPAGESFTVELAHNRGQTTLSFDGQFTSEWPDGNQHPEDWNGSDVEGGCLSDGLMHTQNHSMAAGTAFAISYVSSLEQVTMENLAVFTVLDHTPWKRVATYQVPKDLPSCPAGGCICAWLWVPNGCGQPNMYMAGYKCQVTGSTSTKKVAPAKPPVYCANDATKCVKGAKQMIAWNQLDGDNIVTPAHVSPAYSEKCGWSPGAQNDIFI